MKRVVQSNLRIRKSRLPKLQTNKFRQKLRRLPKRQIPKGTKKQDRRKKIIQPSLLLEQAVDVAFKKFSVKLLNSSKCLSKQQKTALNERDEPDLTNQVSRNTSTTTLCTESNVDVTSRPFLEFIRSHIALLNKSDIAVFNKEFSQQIAPDNVAQNSSNESFFTKSDKKHFKEFTANVYYPNNSEKEKARLQYSKRVVLIDGSNVAYSHTRGKIFSVEGLEMFINYFKEIGHEVKAIVPQIHFTQQNTSDDELLNKLYKDGYVLIIPNEKPAKVSSNYDELFILELAAVMGGVIISNNNYRDLINENTPIRKIIYNRVIGYTWDNDKFILPKDPYGRKEPNLKQLLDKEPKNA